MKKATALYGKFLTVNSQMIKTYEKRISQLEIKRDDDVTDKLGILLERNEDVKEAQRLIDNIEARYEKKIEDLKEKIENWRKSDPKYAIKFEECKTS